MVPLMTVRHYAPCDGRLCYRRATRLTVTSAGRPGAGGRSDGMQIHARLKSVSIYSDLLEASWRTQDRGDHGVAGRRVDARELRRLLEEAIERRRDCEVRARAFGGRLGRAVDAPSDLAKQLAYDLALLRLCAGHGIACDARRFTRPLPERARLEEALERRGIILGDRRLRVRSIE